MGQFSIYAQNKTLDHILKVAPYTPPTHIYIGLSTANPLADASGLAEPSGGSYARIQCDDWVLASQRKTSNASELIFATATGAWGNITHWAIFDTISAGNMLAFGELADSKSGVNATVFSIKAGQIDVEFNTGNISTYLANAILNHVFINATYTPPTHIYVGLAIETIFDSDTGSTITEPADASYSREQFDTWNTASAGASSNNGDIEFAEPDVSWGTATYVALLDALTVGNMLLYAALATAKEINAGDAPISVADEALAITLT